MSGVVRQRARIVRVRRIQHGLAATAAAQAAGQVQQLEMSRERLLRMRSELRSGEGLTSGASLAHMGELAMRLDSARLGLGKTIDSARHVAAVRESTRVAARRDQESAEKLEQAAIGAAERLAERRPLRSGRIRNRIEENGEEK
jgi:hypothetical protein